jgi:hypothetical protein
VIIDEIARVWDDKCCKWKIPAVTRPETARLFGVPDRVAD